MVYTSLPATPLFGLRREMDRLFDDIFNQNGSKRLAWTPPVDIRETEKEFTFQLELPGISPENVEVTAENGVLTVKGEKTMTGSQEGDRWHLTERSHGAFHRSFQLPAIVEESAIEATFSNGLLTVRVPKAAIAQPKRIAIRTEQ
jgi:HSP20 family protein